MRKKFICVTSLSTALTLFLSASSVVEKWSTNAAYAKQLYEPSKVMQQHRGWGYIDTSGAVVIKPQFDWANAFKNGIAKVTIKVTDPETGYLTDRIRYIDNLGNSVKAETNPSTLVPKQVGKKYGYEDEQGKLILPAIWDFADEFSEERAVVGTGNRFKDPHFKIIDSHGKVIADLGATEPFHAFKNGFLVVYDGHKQGYLDLSGKIVIKPQFALAGSFSEGIADARVTPGGPAGLIDMTGKWIVEPKYKWVGRFSEGLAFFDTGDAKGFIDKTGKEIFRLPEKSSGVGEFHEGLASICIGGAPGNFDIPIMSWKGSKLGFIDKSGNLVIQPQYTPNIFSPHFSDGLAPVTIGEGDAKQVGYINKSGKMVIQPRFLEATDFSEGLAGVCFDHELETRTKSGAFSSKELTEDEYIENIFAAIGKSVYEVAPNIPVRCTIEIDSSGRLERAHMRAGSGITSKDTSVLERIATTKLPAKPEYLSAWQKHDFAILINKGTVVKEGTKLDPAQSLFERCTKIDAEIEDTYRLDDIATREKLVRELVKIRQQLFNLEDYELSRRLLELYHLSSRLKHWTIAENAVRIQAKLERTDDLTFTAKPDARRRFKEVLGECSLAELRQKQGRIDDAIAMLLSSAKIATPMVKPYIDDALGNLYFEKKDFAHAEQYYKLACSGAPVNTSEITGSFKVDPKILDIMNSERKEKGLYKLGMFYVSTGNVAKAKSCMDTILKQLTVQATSRSLSTPNGFDWFAAYIDLLNDHGDTGEAEAVSKARDSICGYDQTFIDRTGKQVGHLFFSQADSFKDGLAKVERFDRTGYINKAGEFAIKPKFIHGDDFAEGLAEVIPIKSNFPDNIAPFFYDPMHVSTSDVESVHKWGFIDVSGKLVIPDKYVEARPFSGGLAAVRLNNGYDSWCYIDKKGTPKTGTGITAASPFQGHYASVQVGAAPGTRGCILDIYGGSLKRIDKSGRFLPNKPVPSAMPKKDEQNEVLSLQPFSTTVDGELKWGYIDLNGAVVIPPKFDQAFWFSGDRARVKVKKHMSAINKQGAIVVDPDCDELAAFQGDFAVFKKDRKCGLIDKNGVVIIQPIFDELADFSEGLAAASKDGLYGFIDTRGKEIIQFKFKAVRPFSEGLAAAYDGKHWGYIDKTGAWVIAPRFASAELFQDGRAVVQYPPDLLPANARRVIHIRNIF